MKKKLVLFALVTISILTSCNNPLNKKYDEKTFAEDAKKIVESKKLSEDDAKMLVGRILLSKLISKSSIEGKTYAEILQAVKTEKEEGGKLAAKAKKEEEEKRAKLGAALNVVMYNKRCVKEGYDDSLECAIAFENKTDKDIRAVKGQMIITDLFDEEIRRLELTNDNTIPARQTTKTVFSWGHNKYIDEHETLRYKKMEDLKVVWTAEKIIFTDGSTLD